MSAGAALADKLSDANNYILYDTVNSGGGTLTSDAYILIDSKGDALGGTASSGNYLFVPGLFGLLGVGGATGEVGPIAPTGTVILSISRKSSQVDIKWKTAATPDIYVTSGSGGIFNNEPKSWLKILNGQTGAQDASYNGEYGDFVVDIAQKTLFHDAQVGEGTDEAYYRGLIVGYAKDAISTDPNVPQDTTYLASAWAVGKLNYTCDPGFNLISCPFVQDVSDLDIVFGKQLNEGDLQGADRILKKKSPSAFSYSWAFLNSADHLWHDVDVSANPPTFSTSNLDGYFVWVKGSSKNITLVGRVTNEAVVDIAQGFDLLGSMFPVTYSLQPDNALDLKAAGAGASTLQDADRIMQKKSASSFSYRWCYLDSADNKWHDVDKPTDLASFNYGPPSGYFYWKKGAGSFTWSRILK